MKQIFSAISLVVFSTQLAFAQQLCKVDTRLSQSTSLETVLQRASENLNRPAGALPRIHTEGTLPHQGIYDESIEAAKDFKIMFDAALAWRITGQESYRAMVVEYLTAWVKVYKPSLNPIDETRFDYFFMAYATIRAEINPDLRAKLDAYLLDWGRAYYKSIVERIDPTKSKTSPTWINNWQSHRVKLLSLMAATLENKELIEYSKSVFMQQIADNIRKEGHTEDFEDRDGMRYVVYDLEPLVFAAIALQPYAPDLFHRKSSLPSSLVQAVDWLVPYASGEKQHEEMVKSRVLFDKQRAAAGMKGYSGIWDRYMSTYLYWMSSLLDPKYDALARDLSKVRPDWMDLCWSERFKDRKRQ